MKNMKKKGFTLVELLVVIAILAILATISVVGYTAFVDRANESKGITELTQVKTLVRSQLMVNDVTIAKDTVVDDNGTAETTDDVALDKAVVVKIEAATGLVIKYDDGTDVAADLQNAVLRYMVKADVDFADQLYVDGNDVVYKDADNTVLAKWTVKTDEVAKP